MIGSFPEGAFLTVSVYFVEEVNLYKYTDTGKIATLILFHVNKESFLQLNILFFYQKRSFFGSIFFFRIVEHGCEYL